MLDQDSGDDDDNNTIRLRYLYRGEHKRDGRVATIACENGTIKTKAVLAALRRDRSVDATLETGAIIQVPLFVEIGDVVKVKCAEREFIERAKK